MDARRSTRDRLARLTRTGTRNLRACGDAPTGGRAAAGRRTAAASAARDRPRRSSAAEGAAAQRGIGRQTVHPAPADRNPVESAIGCPPLRHGRRERAPRRRMKMRVQQRAAIEIPGAGRVSRRRALRGQIQKLERIQFLTGDRLPGRPTLTRASVAARTDRRSRTDRRRRSRRPTVRASDESPRAPPVAVVSDRRAIETGSRTDRSGCGRRR